MHREDGRWSGGSLGFERERELAVVQRSASRSEVVVEGVLHERMGELEVADVHLADERGSGSRLDVVEHRALVEVERGRDHGRVELSAGDRCHLEHALRLGIESPDPRVQDRADRARHLDAREVDLGVPAPVGIGREHAGLDEVPHELDREQRVAVGLLLEVRRDHPSVVLRARGRRPRRAAR